MKFLAFNKSPPGWAPVKVNTGIRHTFAMGIRVIFSSSGGHICLLMVNVVILHFCSKLLQDYQLVELFLPSLSANVNVVSRSFVGISEVYRTNNVIPSMLYCIL